MKTKEFETQNGSKGYEYSLEAGDEVVAKFGRVGTNTSGKFDNHFLKVEHDGEEKTIKITNGQKTSLDKIDDLNDKVIVAYEYENNYGKQVGVKLK